VARTGTYEVTTGVAKQYGGAHAGGLVHAETMFNAHEG
jgi:hypothetical protein